MPDSSVPPLIPPSKPIPVDLSAAASSAPGVWERITSWASEHKAVVYTVAGVAVVVTGAGVVYYLRNSETSDSQKPSKKERRKRKEAERKAAEAEKAPATPEPTSSKSPVAKAATVESIDDLLALDEAAIAALTPERRAEVAVDLKKAGNGAYGSKDYNRAIELYTRAIACKADPIFYSNRAACYNALGEWERVVEDTTAALNLDPEYVKALNRRAHAYEKLQRHSDALLDYTASCIIDGFKDPKSAEAVEHLLQEIAQQKAKEMMRNKTTKLGSPTFVGNYLNSFRDKPRPEGLADEVALDENTGKGQLQLGLRAMERKTAEGYEEASVAFERALELGDLGEFEALAYNMRGTFLCLMGKHDESLKALDKSIELDPTMTQSYIKRASMKLETGSADAAKQDFDLALAQNDQDPDIYYHRAQMHFIQGAFPEAAKDYQKSIDLDGEFLFSHIQLGVTQYKIGSIASSMATFRRCLKKFEGVPDVYNYYGELLMDQGNHAEAVEKFDTAMELETKTKPLGINVLPLINKALALFQWKNDIDEAKKLCEKALIIDPECDIAVATMAQLLLHQQKVPEALEYFSRAAELARTEGEAVNALSYAEATRTQLKVTERYPQLASRLQSMGAGGPGMRPL